MEIKELTALHWKKKNTKVTILLTREKSSVLTSFCNKCEHPLLTNPLSPITESHGICHLKNQRSLLLSPSTPPCVHFPNYELVQSCSNDWLIIELEAICPIRYEPCLLSQNVRKISLMTTILPHIIILNIT